MCVVIASYKLTLCLCCVGAVTETAEGQHAQAEEHGNKLKQMLLKTKKDLADAKKLVLLFTVLTVARY